MEKLIQTRKRARVLFANFPADGHFNPLTGLAAELLRLGYDVRWYTSSSYAGKLRKLKIHHYPFQKAVDVHNGDFDTVFPGRQDCRTQLGRLKFDIVHAFILRAPEYLEDVMDIHRDFPFDLLVADAAFTGIPFLREKLNIPVIAIGVFPLSMNSKDLPPSGMGLTPSYSAFGRARQALLRAFANRVIFRGPNKVMHRLLDEHDVHHSYESIFDMLVTKADLLLQSGTPGFEYKRSDLHKNIRFIGPLLPYQGAKYSSQWFDARLNRFKRVVLVTQGTVEKDVNKIAVPTLEAFKNTNTLVICTTGGSQTAALRKRYPHYNIIIEDFIPFDDIMPYVDAYITNGGYGGVMLAIQHNLPMVVAGVHEGKNEICARVGYFKLGINLKTERALPRQIRNAVDEITSEDIYRENVIRLSEEFSAFHPAKLFADHVEGLLKKNGVAVIIKKEEKIY